MNTRAVTKIAGMLALLGTGLVAIPTGCRDDWSADGDGGIMGPCDELYGTTVAAIDEVCVAYPDCSLCDYPFTFGDMQLTDQECQELLDQWDVEDLIEGYTMMCEMEAGSDSDTDIDSDVDTDTDSDCDPPDDVTDWGEACDPEADDCPPETYCLTVEGLDTTIGYCTPLCCEGDNSYCHDIGSGDEQCLVTNSQTEEWWCVVTCTSDEDCVPGTSCQSVNETVSICYAADDAPCDGYTGDDPCCLNDNPCDWELNDICDCDSTCAWDAVDCEW